MIRNYVRVPLFWFSAEFDGRLSFSFRKVIKYLALGERACDCSRATWQVYAARVLAAKRWRRYGELVMPMNCHRDSFFWVDIRFAWAYWEAALSMLVDSELFTKVFIKFYTRQISLLTSVLLNRTANFSELFSNISRASRDFLGNLQSSWVLVWKYFWSIDFPFQLYRQWSNILFDIFTVESD